MIKLTTPLDKKTARALCAGDEVLLSGTIFTARDAAHKRFFELLTSGKQLPVDLTGAILYYTGPSPARPGRPIGSAGPTSSGRMDAYTPLLLEKTGLKGMIGKGNRSVAVVESMKKNGCVYFAASGGCGALMAQCIVAAEIVCYPDLGPEAVYRLTIKDLPAIVAIDSNGGNLYEEGPAAYRNKGTAQR